jgi:predicted aspartyl protease
MIVGTINSDLEPTIRLTVRGPNGRTRRLAAIVDTGFSGFLSMPRRIIDELDLVWDSIAYAELADGSVTQCNIYQGFVVWQSPPLLNRH